MAQDRFTVSPPEQVIAEFTTPDGLREVAFYKMSTMPIGVSADYFKRCQKCQATPGGEYDLIWEQLHALSVGITAEELKAWLPFQDAKRLLTLLAPPDWAEPQKKTESPTLTSSSPGSAGTD